MNVRWYILQRTSAALMAPMVLLHLAVIFYASGHALSAAAILARTRGSLGWGIFYATFVLAASMHAAIGLHGILGEWTPLRGHGRDLTMGAFFLVLTALGLRAVAAVTLP
jgi:fumarate reductase subunit C